MPRMQKANPCLKCSFILFSVLLGIAGCVLFILAVMAGDYIHEVGDVGSGLVWIYLMAVACMILSLLGIFGAYKENSVALQMCLGGMVAGAFILIKVANQASEFAPQVKEGFQTHKRMLMNNDEFIENLRIIETQYECCGVEGYTDYNRLVPNSCECSSEDSSRCTTIHTSSSNSYGYIDGTKLMHVYKQPCGPVILKAISDAIRLSLAFIYCFAAALILGGLLSMSLIYQMKGHCAPEATPVRGSNDLVSYPNSAVPNPYDNMINAVPPPYYPLNKEISV